MEPNDQSVRPVEVVQQRHTPVGGEPASRRRGVFGILAGIIIAFCLLVIAVQMSVIVLQAIAFSDYFDTTEGLQERYHSLDKSARDKIAIIEVSGVIMEGDGHVKHQIDRIRDDDDVKAVIVRIDSPGGTVTGSDYIYHHLCKLRDDRELPLVVSMGSVAASGGYYVAMAVGDEEDSIFAEPTTTTGSIGVIIPHYDVTGLMEEWNVKDDSIASHPRKQMLSMTRAMSDDDRTILESYVNDAFDRFKEIVRSGRPSLRADDEKLTEIATGEIFSANQAEEHGLVDRIGFIEEAIERAAELAGLEIDAVRAVRYQRPVTLFDVAAGRAQSGGFNLATLLELSAPKAYYLNTTLPPLVTSFGR